MALTYQIKINNRTLQATIGVAVHEKLEEALDEAAFHLPITVKGYSEKMLGLLQIVASDGNYEKSFDLLVISDKVSTQSKEGFYSHDLMAIEYTHKLDKIFISALTFTKPFVRKTRAPFKYLGEAIDIDADNTSSPYIAEQLLPKIDFQENYFVNQQIFLKQVGKAFTNYEDGTLQDVYVRVSFPNENFIPQNLTSSDITFTTPEEPGDFIFDIGYYKGSGFQIIYQHYVRVIKEVRYTLYDMIERVRASLPVERESFYERTRIFSLEEDLIEIFKSIDMPQMFFSNLSARQVLNTIFKYINAISRLKYVDGLEDTLTVDFFNKITSSFDVNEVVDLSILKDAQNYGTKAIGFLSNSLQSNFRDNASVQSPANNKYKTVRSNNIQLTRDSFELKLEKPIYEINKITAILPKVEIKYRTNSETYKEELENIEIDITSRTLEKSFWDLKTATNDIIAYTEQLPFQENVGMRLNKNGNIFWQKNSKSIAFNTPISGILSSTLLEEMIQEAVNEEFTLNPTRFIEKINENNIDLSIFEISASLLNREGFIGIAAEELANVLFRNIKFNIEYVTIEDTVALVDKQDISENNYEAYLKINSLSSISDFSRTTRDMFGKLERSAMPVKTISKIHTSLNSLYEIGQIDSQGYIITERKLIFHSEFIEAFYTMTKDHNRLNEFNGINQEYRAFEIPNFDKLIVRKDFYSDYIFIQNPIEIIRRGIDDQNLTLLDFNKYAKLPFGHLDSSSYQGLKEKISYAFVRTDGFLKKYPDTENDKKAIMTPVVSFGGKGSLNFTFDFDSNIVAGDSLVSSFNQGILGIGGTTNIYNQPIAYTDEFGFFDKLWFGMGSVFKETKIPDNIANPIETYFNQEHQYPLINSSDESLGQDFIIKNGEPLNPDWFNVYKDSSTNYGFSYNLSIMPHNFEEYIIGQNFYTENPMVNSHREFVIKKLYVHTDGTTYRKFEDLKVKNYNQVSSIELNENNFKFNETTFTFEFDGNAESHLTNATSWAIGDEDGNLYLACNKNYNGFSIFARHMREELLQIGQYLINRIYSTITTISSNIQVDIFTLLQKFGSIDDEFNSNLSLFVLTEPAQRKDISSSIFSNLFFTALKQDFLKDSFTKVLSSDLIVQAIKQDKNYIIKNEKISSDILFQAIKQNKNIIVKTNNLNSDIVFDVDKQTNELEQLNQTIFSELFFNAFKQNKDGDSLNEKIESEILFTAFRQYKLEGSLSNKIESRVSFKVFEATKQYVILSDERIKSDIIAVGLQTATVRAGTNVLNSNDQLNANSVFNFDYNLGQIDTNIILTDGLDVVGFNGVNNSVRINVPSQIIQSNEVYDFNKYRILYGTQPFEYYSTNPISTFVTDVDIRVTADYDKIPTEIISAKFTNLTNSNIFSGQIDNLNSRDENNVVVNSLSDINVNSSGFQNVYYHYTGTDYRLRVLANLEFTDTSTGKNYTYVKTIARDNQNNIIKDTNAFDFFLENITTPTSLELQYNEGWKLKLRAFATVDDPIVYYAGQSIELNRNGTEVSGGIYVNNYPVTIYAPENLSGPYTEGFDYFRINGQIVNGTSTIFNGTPHRTTTIVMTQNVTVEFIYNQ